MSPSSLLNVKIRSHAKHPLFSTALAYEFHYNLFDSEFGMELKRYILEFGTYAEDLEHVPHFQDEVLFIRPGCDKFIFDFEDWKGYSWWGPVGIWVRGQTCSLFTPWMGFSIMPLINAYHDQRPEDFNVTFDRFWAGVDDWAYGEHFAEVLDRHGSPGAVPKRLGFPRYDDPDRPSATRSFFRAPSPELDNDRDESLDDTSPELYLGALSIGIPGEPAMSGHAYRAAIHDLCPSKSKVKTRKFTIQVVDVDGPLAPQPDVLEGDDAWYEPRAEFLPDQVG